MAFPACDRRAGVRRTGMLVATALFIAVAGVSALSGGSAPLLAATKTAPPVLLGATEQTNRGRELFGMNCARCHGDQGQGTSEGPRIIGSPNAIPTYMTAKGLFDFVSVEMPGDARGTLMPQVYWDVLAFILEANSLLPPDVTLGPDNAANIRLSPEAIIARTPAPPRRPRPQASRGDSRRDW